MILLRYTVLLGLILCVVLSVHGTDIVASIDGRTRYEIKDLRTENGDNGRLTLAFEFKRTHKGEFATHFIKGKSARGLLTISATMPPYIDSGTVRLNSFVPAGGASSLDIELYVVQMTTIGESKYLYEMVSNPIRLGNPGEATTPRRWTEDETAAFKDYEKNKPLSIKRYEVTAEIPKDAVTVPMTAKLVADTKLKACYQSKWWPITTLAENEDGSVRVRWVTAQ